MDIATFSGDVALTAAIHKWNSNRAAELTAIATALGSDTSTHDATLTTPPAGLQPGQANNTKFTNDILLLVNIGKSGNLTGAQMATAINSGLANEIAPVNTAAPVASGTGTVGQVLTTTNGTWTYGQNYTYQWLRGALPIVGATSATYTLVAADSGTNVSCRVTASNPAGSTNAASNAIAVA